MTQSTITAGDAAANSIIFTGGDDNTLAIKVGAAGSKVNAVVFAADGTPTFLKSGMVLGTAQATTSGTSIDFTGIPSWVKKITVSMKGVSTNGTNLQMIQIGSGSIDTTGYNTASFQTNTNNAIPTNGFNLRITETAATTLSGHFLLTHMGSNAWVASGILGNQAVDTGFVSGDKTLSGVLDRIRLTTVGGTDTFDAGSVNILYEG